MRSFKQPVGQIRDACFDYLEDAVFIGFLAICSDDFILQLGSNLEEFPKRTLKQDIVKGGNNVGVLSILGIVNVPLGELSNSGVVDIVVHVLLHFQFAITVEGEEATFGSLKAN